MKMLKTFHEHFIHVSDVSKILKNALLTAILLVTASTFNVAQHQSYWVHTDQVKPSKQAEYEQVSKDFVEACKKHDLKDSDWNVALVDDGFYLSIAPIENMAALDDRV